jgi:formamidopyrimidine-DNA glycosylase
VIGAKVTNVVVHDVRSLKRHQGSPRDFVETLTGKTIDSVVRRGKFLWLPLEGSDLCLIGHLGMSGQVLLREPGVDDDRHLRIRFDVSNPTHGDLVVAFVDQRIFGSMAVDALIEQHGALVPTQVAHIALDPLDERFDDDEFVAALRRKRTGIKRALLDQTLVSGIGNIYADEALWASRLHYDRPADRVTAAQARTVLAEVRAVLGKALAEGGTSFDEQYVNVNGQAGYFAHSLNAYGRQGEPCSRCGVPIVRESFMNRGSHFCPVCQRRPRGR